MEIETNILFCFISDFFTSSPARLSHIHSLQELIVGVVSYCIIIGTTCWYPPSQQVIVSNR